MKLQKKIDKKIKTVEEETLKGRQNRKREHKRRQGNYRKKIEREQEEKEIKEIKKGNGKREKDWKTGAAHGEKQVGGKKSGVIGRGK